MEAVKYAKPLKINRKENLKNHKWYWIGRRTQDVILSLACPGGVFKIKDDPRITRVGKFIRKTSIDELPQLWNILKGDMRTILRKLMEEKRTLSLMA